MPPEGSTRATSPLLDAGGPEWITTPGLTPYQDAIAAMAAHVAAIRAGAARERVWLVEHPPTYTAGTSARAADLGEAVPFPVYAAGRGGQWTYHGPGQLVGYVMLDLQRPRLRVPPRDVRAFVHALEAWLIATLAGFGIMGERREGRVGIWVVDPLTGTEAKIAAIGVRVTRWVTWHGFSLNVAPDLSHYAGIVPCGLNGFGVASMAALGVAADLPAVGRGLMERWSGSFA